MMKDFKDRIEKLEEDVKFWRYAVLKLQKQHMRLQTIVYKREDKYVIPNDWRFEWYEEDVCSKCLGSVITISQNAGGTTQYELRCLDCSSLEGEHYS